MKITHKQSGITLVALVVTIILLLILAGVTIIQLTKNGLLENTKLAKEKSEKVQEQEENILENYEKLIQGARNIKFEESKIINDFTIAIQDVFMSKIAINLSENTSTENVIGYIIFIGDAFIQYKRVKAPTGWGMMFGYDDPCRSVYDHRSLYWDAYENSVCLIVNNDYSQHISFGLDETLPLNTWVNIAVTTDETNTTLYINGKQKSNSFLYKYEIENRKICLIHYKLIILEYDYMKKSSVKYIKQIYFKETKTGHVNLSKI